MLELEMFIKVGKKLSVSSAHLFSTPCFVLNFILDLIFYSKSKTLTWTSLSKLDSFDLASSLLQGFTRCNTIIFFLWCNEQHYRHCSRWGHFFSKLATALIDIFCGFQTMWCCLNENVIPLRDFKPSFCWASRNFFFLKKYLYSRNEFASVLCLHVAVVTSELSGYYLVYYSQRTAFSCRLPYWCKG